MTEVISKQKEKFKYPSLNGLRAISILIVVFHHIELNYKVFGDNIPDSLKAFYELLIDGQFGVNVFFIISGFLITSLLIIEEKNTGTISFKNFYLRRTLRIFPAYYFYLLFLYILQLLNILSIDNRSWLTSITYMKYFNRGLDYVTSHAWSLSIEEHFYLFFPLLFVYGGKIRKTSIFMLILFVPLIKIFCYYYPISYLNNNLTIIKRIDALAIGCLVAFYKDSLLKILGKKINYWFYFSLVVIFIIPFLSDFSEEYNLHLGFILVPFGTRYGTIANICISIILLYSVFGHKGLWYRLLNSKVFEQIGLLSYSIYLWQQLFISPLKFWAFSYPQNIMFVIAFALFSYYCIEKPFLKMKDKLSGNIEINKNLVNLKAFGINLLRTFM